MGVGGKQGEWLVDNWKIIVILSLTLSSPALDVLKKYLLGWCPKLWFFICIWVRSRNCGCLVTWFCYQLIAKPGNKTAAVLWPDPYIEYRRKFCSSPLAWLVVLLVPGHSAMGCIEPCVTDGMGGCHYDNCQCHLWWHSWRQWHHIVSLGHNGLMLMQFAPIYQ